MLSAWKNFWCKICILVNRPFFYGTSACRGVWFLSNSWFQRELTKSTRKIQKLSWSCNHTTNLKFETFLVVFVVRSSNIGYIFLTHPIAKVRHLHSNYDILQILILIFPIVQWWWAFAIQPSKRQHSTYYIRLFLLITKSKSRRLSLEITNSAKKHFVIILVCKARQLVL